MQGLNKMAEPAKNAGISLIVHLAALFLMLIVFKWNIYALVGEQYYFLALYVIFGISVRSV